MKGIKLIIFILTLLPVLAVAQPIKSAQKAMDQFDYVKAVTILKDALSEKEFRSLAIPMLADCYRQQHDYANAKRYYAQAVALPETKSSTFLYYGQILQFTGDYVHARDMFQKYTAMEHDGKEKIFSVSCDSVLGPWKNLDPEYEIKTVNYINSPKSDFGPAFSNGSLVYSSDNVRKNSIGKEEYERTGISYLDLMKSVPVNKGDFWGKMGVPSEFDSKLNQKYHDGPACFSADGNTVYLTRSFQYDARKENGVKTYSLKIFYSTKINGEWGEVKPFFLNSREYSIGHPSLSMDGKTVYFASDMPGGFGGTDIWMCTRSGSNWSQAVNLGEKVNTSNDEMFPYIREDGSLYFASDGHPGYGGLDIFKSVKVNGKWSAPVNLHAPINSSYDDFALEYAPGMNNGFFSSNRKDGKGKDDIYAFRLLYAPEALAMTEIPDDANTKNEPEIGVNQSENKTITEPEKTVNKTETKTVTNPEIAINKTETNTVTSPDIAVNNTETKKVTNSEIVVNKTESKTNVEPTIAVNPDTKKVTVQTTKTEVAVVPDTKKNPVKNIIPDTKKDSVIVSVPDIVKVTNNNTKPSNNQVTNVPVNTDLTDNGYTGQTLISGVVKVIDKVAVSPVEGATVFVFDQVTHKIKVLKTGSDGVYSTMVEKPADLVVKAVKSNYLADCTPFFIQKTNTAATVYAPRDLLLNRLEVNQAFTLDNIYFDFDKYNIRVDAKPELDKLVRIMMENPVNVEIASHTDSRGSYAYNDHLSQNRANSVANYIVSKDIERSRISAKGYGERQLLNNCKDGVKCTPAEHKINRRTEFRITGYTNNEKPNPQFNPEQFIAGEIITEGLLPDAFFSQCASGKQIIPNAKPTENYVQKKTGNSQNYSNLNNANQSYVYTVQFATGSVRSNIAKTISGIMTHKGDDGILRFYVGQFNNLYEARSLKSEMINKGFTDAWIATIDDKRPVKP